MDLMLNRWLLYQTLSSRACSVARASTSRAARSAFATSSRTSWRCSTRRRERRARTSSRPPRTNSRRATSCTGGIRRRAAACARAAPTTWLWLPFVTAEYVAATGDVAILDEPVPFLDRRRRLRPDEHDRYAQYRRLRGIGTALRALPASARARRDRGAPRAAAHGRRRLERRHEPRRRARVAARACGSAGFSARR